MNNLTLKQNPKSDIEEIQEVIRERICFLEYPPGTILKETLLATEFGVSRTPLREALNRLHHLGLIETRNGVGTVVVELSPQILSQIYEMRLELAVLIGKLTPNTITHEHEEISKRLLAETQKLHKSFDAHKYFQINHELNNLIQDIIGNVALKAMWKQLYSQAASTWYRIAKLDEEKVTLALIEELSDLCLALHRRDAEAVGYSQRIHINFGFVRVKRLLNIDNTSTT
ncbi:MAG: GntR family transcriptional regulator [Halopseudomonas aestusnigri]